MIRTSTELLSESDTPPMSAEYRMRPYTASGVTK